MNILLIFAVIILATKLFDSIAIRMELPAVVGSLIAGILIGPSGFNIIQTNSGIEIFAHIGVILLMFLAGLECDLQILRKYFKPSLIVGTLGVFVPFILFGLVSMLFSFSGPEALAIGLVFGATSLSITIQVLKELNYVQTKEGAVIIGAAVLDDIIVIILLNVMLNVFADGSTLKALVPLLIGNVFFFLLIYLIHKLVMPFLVKLIKTMEAPEVNMGLSLVLCLGLSALAETIGMSDIIGAFFAGILISQTEVAHVIEDKTNSLAQSIFAPVFFVSIGLKLALSGLSNHLWLIVAFTFLAIISKFIGGYLGARMNGFNPMSSSIIGTSMESRGEMALILLSLGLETGSIQSEIYGALVIVIIASTIIAPIMLRALIIKSREKYGMEELVIQE